LQFFQNPKPCEFDQKHHQPRQGFSQLQLLDLQMKYLISFLKLETLEGIILTTQKIKVLELL